MYDVIIVGSGPAAVSAALTLRLHKREVLLFGPQTGSNKVQHSEKIANYPGVPMVSGADLSARFVEQLAAAGVVPQDQIVTNIMASGDGYMVLANNEVYESRTVLLATGSVSAKGFPGEEALLGYGVSYCATCDGFLYQGKTVGAFCQDARFLHEVIYLAELVQTVYFFPLFAVEEPLPENVICPDARIRAIAGESHVTGLELSDGSTLPVDGVFLLRGSVAPAQLLKGLEMDGPHIRVDRAMRTNKPGCFAAGDCTGRPYQIAKAVGEGNVAAHSIDEYLVAKFEDA